MWRDGVGISRCAPPMSRSLQGSVSRLFFLPADSVSKISYASLALIAAIPGGYLSYLLVMTMLDNFGKMPGMFKILSCAILACSALMAVMPIGILIFVRDEETAKDDEAVDEIEDVEDVEDIDEVEAAETIDEDVDATPVAAFDSDEVEVTDTDQVEYDPDSGELDQSESVEFEADELPGEQDSEEFVFDEDMYMTDDEDEKKK